MDEQRPGEFELAGDLYILPTPAGAYFAVSSAEDSRVRRLLLALLRYRSSPHVDTEFLCRCLDTTDAQEALEVLHRAQSLAWIEGYTEVRDVLVEAGNVICVFHGHDHWGGYSEIDGIHYVTFVALLGMSWGKPHTWAFVTLDPAVRTITVEGAGEQPNLTLDY